MKGALARIIWLGLFICLLVLPVVAEAATGQVYWVLTGNGSNASAATTIGTTIITGLYLANVICGTQAGFGLIALGGAAL